MNGTIGTIFLFILSFNNLFGQQQFFYNPNDERFKSLYLEKVESEYKIQKEDFERQKNLFEKGLISAKEFHESETRFLAAQITYKQAVLALAFEKPYITIDRAIKYQNHRGEKAVRLTLRNTTSGLIEGKKAGLLDFEDIRTDQIANIYVSLLNDERGIISQPYEAKIDIMPFNRPINLNFTLLQDVDYCTVKIVYGDKTDEKKIYLRNDPKSNKVLVVAKQFSQEADLGGQATYELVLEPYTNLEKVYKLAALNLSRQILYDFIDDKTGARISQIKFSQATEVKIKLVVYLPDRYDSTAFEIDKPLVFFIISLPEDKFFDTNNTFIGTGIEKQLDGLNIGYTKLELIPRGIGKIELRSSNFYKETRQGEKVFIDFVIQNSGTRRLDNVQVVMQAPLRWISEIQPDLISLILPGKEQQVNALLQPPQDISVGDYEATVKIEANGGGRIVQSQERKIRLHVYSSSNVLGIITLILFIVGIIGAIIFLGVRLVKK